MFPFLCPRQMSIAASYLRSVGHGVVAGDFNPVLPEDETLVRDNNLIDAWTELHPNEEGLTWGLDSDEPFPPRRMDKVALVGLKACDIHVIRPGTCATNVSGKQVGLEQEEFKRSDQVPWSDHSGLVCGFGL